VEKEMVRPRGRRSLEKDKPKEISEAE